MPYSFTSGLLESGNRTFIEIPFNVWDTCNQKGMISVSVMVEDVSFECKLVPKGDGKYYIPITKTIIKKLERRNDLYVQFEIIDKLSRITANSPYNKEKPIRKIDSINYIKTPADACGYHACVAMLANVSVDEAMKVMQSNTKWEVSISKVIEALDYYGIRHADKFIYTKGKQVDFPKCCIVNAKAEPNGLLMVYYNEKYYNPAVEVQDDYDSKRIVSYMEIYID